MKPPFYFSLLIFSFIISSCSNAPLEIEEEKMEKETVIEAAPTWKYRFNPDATTVKWTAFKHSKKVPVNGKLGKSGGGAPGKYKRNMDHFAVQLIEFDEAKIHAQLRRYGVDPSSIERRYGSLGHGPSMYVYDPDGNTIELKGPPDKDQKENIQSAIYKSSVQARAATEFAKKTILTSARRRKNTVKGG